MAINFNDFTKLLGLTTGIGGATGLASNLFGGDPGAPYKAGMSQANKYANQAAGYQNPFYNMGTSAIPQYQDYLSKMSDPTQFINDIMGQYSSSPYSEYEQEQAMRASTNMASQSGLTGSTPLMLQEQENSEQISNKDMEQWLNHVLGINKQYGSGLQYEMGSGQEAANQLNRIYESLGRQMSSGAYGKTAARNNQTSDIFGDIGSLLTGAGLYFL